MGSFCLTRLRSCLYVEVTVIVLVSPVILSVSESQSQICQGTLKSTSSVRSIMTGWSFALSAFPPKVAVTGSERVLSGEECRTTFVSLLVIVVLWPVLQ